MFRLFTLAALSIICLAGITTQAQAEDLPVIHFEPSAADKLIHSPAPTKLKRKQSKTLKAVKAASVASYLTGCAVRGAATGYALNQQRLNNSGIHSYNVTRIGNTVTVQQSF